MRIRLTRRLSERIDDVDLSERRVGDCFELSDHDGAMLIAEGWVIRPKRRNEHFLRTASKHADSS